MECSICCEEFSFLKRVKKECPYCNFASCQICIQKYLIGSTLDPHCMNCHKAWDQEIIESHFSKPFRNVDYKKHRENILYDREKSLLPETQPYVQLLKDINVYKDKNNDIDNQIIQMNSKVVELRNAFVTCRRNDYKNTEDSEKYREEMRRVYRDISKIKLERMENNRAIWGLRYAYRNNETRPTPTADVRRIFTIGCPINGCKGFVNGKDWNCGICRYYVCKVCHEPIGEEKNTAHTCRDENIETAKMIKKEARSCPGCSTLIYRINGCSQMWCTQCHTAFDWNTGQIEKGLVHNPHFYEYQRLNQVVQVRDPGDVPCGMVTYRALLNYFERFDVDEDYRDSISDLHRVNIHIQMVELPRYRVQFFVNTNLDLRVKFLMNEITETEFKRKLQISEKNKYKKRDIFMVLEMLMHTMNDMFRNLTGADAHEDGDGDEDEDEEGGRVAAAAPVHVALAPTEDCIIHWLSQVENLQKYTNKYLEKISKRYDCVVPYINKHEVRSFKY